MRRPLLSPVARLLLVALAPDETVTVTLDLSKLHGPAGREGSGKVSTSFLVPVTRE
jgi:hypothetical protein